MSEPAETSAPATYLLDTHALVWALTEPEALGPAAVAAISDSASELLVSAVSGWEIATKHRLGKLPRAEAVLDALPTHLARLGASVLPVSLEHALLAGSMEWEHRDPFDRMLAAQAILEAIPLITTDQVFASRPGVGVVW